MTCSIVSSHLPPSTMRRTTSILALLSLTLPLLSVAAPAGDLVDGGRNNGKIPGQYIVVFKDDANVDELADTLPGKHRGQLLHVYKSALKGMAIALSDGDLADLRKNPNVAMVSPDYEVTMLGKHNGDVSAQAQTLPTGVNRIDAELNLTNKGSGIGVAVIDTGISLTHTDLGTVISGKNCVQAKKRNANANDDNGHGTHVAGTVAARDNGFGVVGVAPLANLIAVKVLNSQGSGTWSSVICGIDWVTANAAKYNIKVANMSLGGGGSSDNNCGNTNNDALHKAICRSTAAGVTYVIAAGNSGSDAGTSVPAAYDDTVITVSALADSDGLAGGLGSATGYGADDTFASFSNYGSVVDVGAPGVNIYSTWLNGGYNTISGTSMASPHVAGAAALWIKSHPGSTWSQVRDGLTTAGEVLGAGHTDPSGRHPEPVVIAGGL